MGGRQGFSSKPPRKNRSLKQGDVLVKKEKCRKKSPVRRVVVGSLLASLLVLIMIGGRSAHRAINEWTAIQTVTVLGLDRLSREEITGKLQLSPESSLWSIDTDRMTTQLQSHPWIRAVTFDRVFPHALIIQVEERQPAAELRGSKKPFFVDAEGFLLPGKTTTVSHALPILKGMPSNFFSQDQGASHRRAKQGIHLAKLLSERFSGRPTIHVGHAHTTIIDYPRIRVQFGQEADRQWERFLVLYPTIKETIERQSQEVDLRFSQKVILRKRTL